MVGNDVVDLLDPESDVATLHPRWDARVFSESERRHIAARGDRDPALRWKLWAAKEAAYKLARKLDPATVFSPPTFEVELGANGAAKVYHGPWRFPVTIQVEDDGIHAIAREEADEVSEIVSGERRITSSGDASAPGREVRSLALDGVATALGAARDEFEVRRENRIPRVFRKCGERARVDLSISHHGQYVGFACVATGAERVAN